MERPMLLRIDEVSHLLGIGRSQAYALCAAGRLPSLKIGKSVRVPAAALERWVQEQTVRAAEDVDGGDAA